MAIEVALAPFQKFLEYLQSNRFRREDRIDKAVEAIDEALIATLQYVELSTGKKGFDRNTEFELAEKWAKASRSCIFIAPKLKTQFYTKSEYWRDRFEWTDEEIDKNRISFERIKEDI